MFDLSIVLPTCNRANMLRDAIDTIARNTRCNYELIIVDGASTDHTGQVIDYAAHQLGGRLQVIREQTREGFVRAANKGFRAATGRNLTWLNDDARPIGAALDLAVAQIDSAEPDVAFVAMFHRWHSRRNIAYQTMLGHKTYQLCHVRGTLYANFPVGKRETYQKLGLFDERFYINAADPDLSLKAWNTGMRVVPAFGAIIDHDEHNDDRRKHDLSRAEEDNEKLFAKWNLPPKNPKGSEFNPARPCTLNGLRAAASAA